MKYTENELRAKTLTELRKIGGSVGVAKYSRKQADELIELILAIQNGEVEPAVMKRGRPRKDARTQTDIIRSQAESENKTEKEEDSGAEKSDDNEKDDGEEAFRHSEGVFDFRNRERKTDSSESQPKKPVYDEYVASRLSQSRAIRRDVLRQKANTEWKFKSPESQARIYAEQQYRATHPESEEFRYVQQQNTELPERLSYDSRVPEQSDFNSAKQTSEDNSQKDKKTENVDLQQDSDRIGIVELMPDGYGLLRTVNYYPADSDVYIPAMQLKRFQLRNGDKLHVRARPFPNNKYPSAIFIYSINDIPCDQLTVRPNFEDLVPIYPDERIRLEDGQHRFDIALRAIDLVSPIGRGQRGLIVSPPKAGKTVLLKSIAQAILRNYEDIHVFVLLVDERPEEVTDIQESVDGAEIVYSTFDMTPEHHTKVAELVMQRAKRMVELGKHVVILLDSITRLSRAYNQVTEQTGKTLTGGLDSAALYEPKKFFGAARNIKNGGSLTVIATALVDTGSKMDDIIYEEFKGTGNMEIHLSRKMSEKRIFPAIDLNKSGTRREELLLNNNEQEGMWILRRILSKADNAEATEKILDMLVATKNNEEFLEYVRSKIGKNVK